MKAIVHGAHALARWMEQPGVTLNVLAIVFGLIGVVTSVLGVFMMVEANQKMDVAAFAQFTTSQQMVAMALHDLASFAPSEQLFTNMSPESQKGVLEKTMRGLVGQFGNVALRNSPQCYAAWHDFYGYVYVVLNGGFSPMTSQKLTDGFYTKQGVLLDECSDFLK